MLQKDKKVLASLVEKYTAAQMVGALVTALREHRDELSDLGLKEKAIQYAEIAELLSDISLVLTESE